MNIDSALRNMDSSSRELVKKNIEAYLSTGKLEYAKEAVAILKNFADDDDVRDLIEQLSR